MHKSTTMPIAVKLARQLGPMAFSKKPDLLKALFGVAGDASHIIAIKRPDIFASYEDKWAFTLIRYVF